MLLAIRLGGMNAVLDAIGNADSCEFRLRELPQIYFIVFGNANASST